MAPPHASEINQFHKKSPCTHVQCHLCPICQISPYSSQAPLRVRWGVNVLRADFLPWKPLPRDDPALRTNALTPRIVLTHDTDHRPRTVLPPDGPHLTCCGRCPDSGIWRACWRLRWSRWSRLSGC
ncbi:hypothetical protein CEXT_377941 [Caerostris extrusa]|uniref:Uncharacterized protein n=1 Tax=Caerostris extrusa TaxID=172846 RepID=A0AAV4WU69_CAEEX|nr:hypothetical protein CEXT_377941 [Caerostris extrusa]